VCVREREVCVCLCVCERGVCVCSVCLVGVRERVRVKCVDLR